MPGIEGHHIAEVVNKASSLQRGNDLILSLLTRALISAAKTAGVSRKTVVYQLDKAWDSSPVLSPIIGPRLDRIG